MTSPSVWHTLRRRLAPAAFFVALLVLASQTCESELAEVTVVVELGRAAPLIRQLQVDLYEDGAVAPISTFERTFTSGAPSSVSFTLATTDGAYRVDITATTANEPVWIDRVVTLSSRAAVTVAIEDELMAAVAP